MSETRVSHVMVRRGWRAWKHINPAVVVLLALVVAISLMSPLYRTPAGLMILLQRAAPLMVLTCGQTFVLATGGFDLSVGSIMTLAVIGCALLTGGDPSLTAVAIGAVAIGRIKMGQGRVEKLSIGTLTVDTLIIREGTTPFSDRT